MVMRKNGTCRTVCSRKCRPPTTLSSHVVWSMLMTSDAIHSSKRTPTTYSCVSILTNTDLCEHDVAYWYGHDNTDSNASCYRYCSLSIVI